MLNGLKSKGAMQTLGLMAREYICAYLGSISENAEGNSYRKF